MTSDMGGLKSYSDSDVNEAGGQASLLHMSAWFVAYKHVCMTSLWQPHASSRAAYSAKHALQSSTLEQIWLHVRMPSGGLLHIVKDAT